LRDGDLRTDGHVTSSYHSPNLGHPVALAMVRSGRSRFGEQITLYDVGKRLRATIVNSVSIDVAGDRLRA
jgi:sarcosine oxidase, subunit alpha